jgi:hypothetical protein
MTPNESKLIETLLRNNIIAFDKCSSPVEAFYNRGSHFGMDLCVGCRGEDQESPYFIEVHADWQPPKKSIVEINITL